MNRKRQDLSTHRVRNLVVWCAKVVGSGIAIWVADLWGILIPNVRGNNDNSPPREAGWMAREVVFAGAEKALRLALVLAARRGVKGEPELGAHIRCGKPLPGHSMTQQWEVVDFPDSEVVN